ncbi:MAG: enoyl-CoA hydratase/isomerase family protein [Chitinophagaceae bacterium]|nr:enoyl-CoA hydratase/isomerase family protein [Chitinophagaceae bacterium]
MSYIQYEIRDSIATIVLNRADKYNSFCREMALDMQQALDQAAADTTVRCVYITGAGKAFCAGQDLAEAIEDNGIELSQIVTEHYNPIIMKMREMPKPVICAVNGVAAGAGANIALAGDIVVATASASFIQAFSKIGLIPDSGGTFLLPRLIGFQKATALMMLGEKVMAEEAEKLGMIYKFFADENFAGESWKLAQTLAAMPTKGLALTKQLLNESADNNLTEQLKLEGEIQVLASQTFDYNEGVTAFLEKRKPSFKGV